MAVRKFSFDVVNQTLVSWQGSATTLEFGQSVYSVEIRLVQPAAETIPGKVSYEPFDPTGYDGLRIGIWSNSTGALGDSGDTILALTPHTGFTYNTADPDDPYYSGTFSTYTEEIATWFGTAKTKGAYLAVNLVSGTTLTRVFDHKNGATNCTLNTATDDGSGDLPVDLSTAVPTTTLPWHIHDPASGEVYALTRTSAGVLEFVWLNP